MTDYERALREIAGKHGQAMASVVHAVIQTRVTITIIARDLKQKTVPIEKIKEAVAEMTSTNISAMCELLNLDFESHIKPLVQQVLDNLDKQVLQ